MAALLCQAFSRLRRNPRGCTCYRVAYAYTNGCILASGGMSL